MENESPLGPCVASDQPTKFIDDDDDENDDSTGLLPSTWLRVALAITMWWLANGSTVLVNKWLFQHEQFRYPLSLTLFHMIAQSILSRVAVDALGWSRSIRFSAETDTYKVWLLAGVFCLNITLGNIALRWIPVSFFEVVKSSSPVFTSCLTWLIMGRRLTARAAWALVPVVGGAVMATLTEMSFEGLGFLAAILSCLMTGLKTVLSAELLQGRYHFDALQLIYYMAPPSALLLLPLVVFIEGHSAVEWFRKVMRGDTIEPIVVLWLSCVCALLLNLCVFDVLRRTSSVTLSVAGNLKVVGVIYASLLIFRNPFTWMNIAGSLVALMGCTWYGLLKHKYVH